MNIILKKPVVKNRHHLFISYMEKGIQLPKLTLEEALAAISNTQGITGKELSSSSRKREIVAPRHVFCYLAYHYTTIPLIEVGKLIGNRDHSTVLSGNRTVEDAISIGYEPIVEMVNEVKQYLGI